LDFTTSQIDKGCLNKGCLKKIDTGGILFSKTQSILTLSAILAGLPLILTWVMIIMSKRYFISETADEFNQKS
jgi:predicted aconitase with swiveling domain